MKSFSLILNDLLVEKRRNPEQNISLDDVWKFILDKNNPAFANPAKVWMTFVNERKLGLNPINNFDTPTGVYSYNVKDYLTALRKEKRFEDVIPFMDDGKYIIFFNTNFQTRKRIIISSRYGSSDFDRDTKKLKEFYENRIASVSDSDLTKNISRVNNRTSDIKHHARTTKDWSSIEQKLDGYYTSMEDDKVFNSSPLPLDILENELRELSTKLSQLEVSPKEEYILDMIISDIKYQRFGSIQDNYNYVKKRYKDFPDKSILNNLVKPPIEKFLKFIKIENIYKISNYSYFKTLYKITHFIKYKTNKTTDKKRIEQYKKDFSDFLLYFKHIGMTGKERYEINKAKRRLENISDKLSIKSATMYRTTDKIVPFDDLYQMSNNDGRIYFRKMWYLTNNIATELSKIERDLHTSIWTYILRNVLNIGGCVDKSGTIHPNEPKQTVFFETAYLKPIAIFTNKNFKLVATNEKPQ
jgi:hypothetical protein